MESAGAFIERIKNDETLLLKLSNLMAKEDTQGVNELLQANGVSEEGIASLIHLNKTDSISTSGELSDEDLAAVSGGGFNWCNGIKMLVDSF